MRGARAIVAELAKYDPALHAKPRWLVLNKLDLLPEDERVTAVKAFVKTYRWKGPVHAVSAISGDQLKLKAIMATGRWVLKGQD